MSAIQTTLCPLCGGSKFFLRGRAYGAAPSVSCARSECEFSVKPDMEALAAAAVATYERDHRLSAEAESRVA